MYAGNGHGGCKFLTFLPFAGEVALFKNSRELIEFMDDLKYSEGKTYPLGRGGMKDVW